MVLGLLVGAKVEEYVERSRPEEFRVLEVGGEIASMLGVKVGTVKSQVHRARKILLERLDR